MTKRPVPMASQSTRRDQLRQQQEVKRQARLKVPRRNVRVLTSDIGLSKKALHLPVLRLSPLDPKDCDA